MFVKTGLTESSICLEDLIKLYINHRPVLHLEKGHISAAFDRISQVVNEGGMPGELQWQNLRGLLQYEGEGVSAGDLDAFLTALTGSSSLVSGDSAMDARTFAEQVLGFDDN